MPVIDDGPASADLVAAFVYVQVNERAHIIFLIVHNRVFAPDAQTQVLLLLVGRECQAPMSDTRDATRNQCRGSKETAICNYEMSETQEMLKTL